MGPKQQQQIVLAQPDKLRYTGLLKISHIIYVDLEICATNLIFVNIHVLDTSQIQSAR